MKTSRRVLEEKACAMFTDKELAMIDCCQVRHELEALVQACAALVDSQDSQNSDV